MKVALLTDGIWPNAIGGIQKHSYYLCKYLSKAGVTVDLYHTLKNKPQLKNVSESFDSTELLNINFFLVDYPAGIYFPGHYIWNSYRYSKNIFKQIQPLYETYDIIYIQGFCGWFLLENRKKIFKQQVSCVLNMHGLEMFQNASSLRSRMEQFMFRPFAKKQLLKSDYVQSLGGKLTDILQSIGVQASKILVCGIAVEKKWLKETIVTLPGIRTFVFVGRYEKRKGIEVLNAVIKDLINEDARFYFHFIGPLPQAVQISHKAIKYHGKIVDDDIIMSILDNVHFEILPSYSEGMPTVILEAMARGCAVIASDVGAVPKLLSEKNGFLTKAGNKASLYLALKTAINMSDSDLQSMKIISNRKVKEKFLWEELVIEMIDTFSRIKNRRPGDKIV